MKIVLKAKSQNGDALDASFAVITLNEKSLRLLRECRERAMDYLAANTSYYGHVSLSLSRVELGVDFYAYDDWFEARKEMQIRRVPERLQPQNTELEQIRIHVHGDTYVTGWGKYGDVEVETSIPQEIYE